jgi:hypothetical protein
MNPRKNHSAVAVALVGTVVLLGISACGGSSPTGSPERSSSAAETSGGTVSKYEVAEELQPLTKAVVAYTDSDYGEDPADPATLAQAEANFDKVLSAKDQWLSFVAGIDFASSDISGLESAIQGYNGALDDWQALQESGLIMWQDCIDASSDSTAVAMCMVEGYSASDEQAALTNYTSAVKELLGVLGVSL